MINTFKLPLPGRILAIGVFSDGGVPAILKQFVSDEMRAENVLKKFKKEVLRRKISKFLNHRHEVMENYGGLRTQSTANAWTALKNQFEYLKDHSLEANCRFIITSRAHFDSLMPGSKSRFYMGTVETMNEVFAFCESEINNQQLTSKS